MLIGHASGGRAIDQMPGVVHQNVDFSIHETGGLRNRGGDSQAVSRVQPQHRRLAAACPQRFQGDFGFRFMREAGDRHLRPALGERFGDADIPASDQSRLAFERCLHNRTLV